MRHIFVWFVGGISALMLVFALMMRLIGTIIVQRESEFFLERQRMGFSIAYNVGTCGAVLLAVALLVWFLSRRRAPPT